MNYLTVDWPAPASVKALVTLRHTWQGKEALASLLQLPAKPIWIEQKHTHQVVEALPENNGKIADAVFASTPNQVCVVTTADCLPVLICNQQGDQVAAIHAGWRGLAAGIIEATLEKFTSSPENLFIWLGPAIGPQKFEVGEDVYAAFTDKHLASKAAFKFTQPGKWLADLYHLAKIRLQLRGINETQIYGGQFCTYSQEDLFFSYRRDKSILGHIASVIWLASNN